ncbi:MAG: hypothetical protein DWG80_07060, partial [Chloroflexi bacterium]|nr:hypothetical protein [Chloroflexota bacterium]
MTRRALPLVLVIAVVFGLLAVVALPRTARAQQPPTLQAAAAFDPPSASIGDRVTLTLRVTHPEDVIVKAEAPNLEHVDIVSTQPSRTATIAPGAHTTTFEYTLQPFLLGTIDTGTIRLSWLRADGATGTLNVPGAQLIVAPVRAPADEALRPLKPQASVLGAPPSWVRPA